MKVLYPVCIIFVLKIDIPMDILFLVGGLSFPDLARRFFFL